MHASTVESCTPGFTPPRPQPYADPQYYFSWLRSAAVLPKVIQNPIESFSARAYEELYFLTPMFQQTMAMVHDPDLLRHIFIENADLLIAAPVRQRVLKPALREGMLTAEGDVWRRARRTIAPVFAPRHVLGFSSKMQAVTAAYAERLAAETGIVPIADHMTRLAYLILSDTLFSGDLDGDSETIIADVAYFLQHLSRPDPIDFLNAPDWVPRLTKLRGTGALKRLRNAVRATAEKRQNRIDNEEAVPQDFLTLLLQAQDDERGALSLDEIEDNIITFIAAGHETTARALAWTLYLLASDPAALQRCYSEVDALDIATLPPHQWGDQLPWLTACFEESMRLYPPAGIIARKLNGTIDHGDFHIGDGTVIVTSPWVLHRHKKLWQKPDQFHPERFLGENRNSINRFSYLPFGLGHRVCIGNRFAMQEAQIILVNLLRNFTFEYAGKTPPWPVMKVTIQPDNGIPIRMTPRRPSPKTH